MDIVFFVAAAVAIVATILAVVNVVAVHALLYFIVSLLAVAVVFFTLGAPFVAGLEVIVYAGAIMVLFVFVVMMLNYSRPSPAAQRRFWDIKTWAGPVLLALILLGELGFAIATGSWQMMEARPVDPAQVGAALYGPYVVAVELASLVLLAGLVGAYHLGRRGPPQKDAPGDLP